MAFKSSSVTRQATFYTCKTTVLKPQSDNDQDSKHQDQDQALQDQMLQDWH